MLRKFTKVLFYLLAVLLLVVAVVIGFNYTPDIPLDELKQHFADANSKFVDVDGMNVHYKDEGKGPVLVLLHGTASSLQTWDGWVREMKGNYRIIRMDLPAFGLTGPNADNDYNYSTYVQFLHDFLQKMHVDSFALAGNSLGGGIAWDYALHYPQQVKQLILIDAAGYPRTTPIPLAFKIGRTPILKNLMRIVSPRSLYIKSIKDVYYNDSLVTDSLIDRYYDLSLRPGNREALVARMNLSFNIPYDSLGKIKCPTLIMWGKHDAWIPLADGHRFDKDIPNSYLITYENAGHVPMEEVPVQTSRDAQGFLRLTAHDGTTGE